LSYFRDVNRGDGEGGGGEPRGLRERKKLATRQALSAAAIRLAVEQGLDSVRVEDIAEAAGVSARTFNNYFSSREQAICAARAGQVERIAITLLERPAGEPLLDAITHAVLAESPREPLREVLQLFAFNPTLHGEFLRTAAQSHSPLIEAIARRTGTEPTGLLSQVVASSVFCAIRAAMHQWLSTENPQPYRTVVRDALDQLRKLTTPEAAAAEGEPHAAGASVGGATIPDRAAAPASTAAGSPSARPSFIGGWAA
jgi:AcrR family transcriptional regulator